MGSSDDVVLQIGGLRVTLALVRAFAAFWLSVIVIVGSFILIALEKETQIDTAFVGIISAVVTAWASYFAHLAGANGSHNGTHQ